MNGAHCASARAHGLKGGRPQSCPSRKNSSGGGKANRDVGDQADLASGTGQLAVDVKLQPGVECDPISEAFAGGSDARCGWVADLVRPVAPGRPVLLAEGVERRVVAQGATL